jgi:antitoxin CptB
VETNDSRRKRILYRAQRRGFKEADLLVGGFAAAILPRMDEAALDAFEALLELPDHEIQALVLGDRAPPPEHDTHMLAALRQFYASSRR